MQVVNTLCDLCHTVGKDVTAVTTMVVAINKKATELDVCSDHSDEIHARLEDVFEVGRRPGNLNLVAPTGNGKPAKNKEGDFACDRCTRSFPTLQGLSMHRSRTHKLMSATKEATRKREVKAAEANGHVSELPMETAELPEGMDRAKAEAMIDDGWCIYDETHGPFQGRSNVGTHLRKQHGVSISALGLAQPTGQAARQARAHSKDLAHA